jgi:hypothetical protein
MYVGVPQCMDYVLDNLWCSNFKNLCVPKFLPTLYIVFHPFLSMLPIVHVNKPVTTIYMIFVDFPRFFFGTASPKTDGINFVQNRSDKLAKLVGLSNFGSVYRSDSNFSTI